MPLLFYAQINLSTIVFLFDYFHSNLGKQEVNYALFRYHLNLINPAAAGTQGAAYLNLGVRNQWQGVADAPQSFSLHYNAPQKNERVGLGINVNNDKTFVEQQTQAFVDFSYRLPLGDEKAVYLGKRWGNCFPPKRLRPSCVSSQSTRP